MKQRVTDAEIARVADIYRAARERGERPALTVMTELGVNRSAASRRIAVARDRGLLEPARAGRVYPTNQKAELIAAELGVTYRALVEAVLKHAGGDLRVASV